RQHPPQPPNTIVVFLRVPSTIERVILIVSNESEQYNEYDGNEISSDDPSRNTLAHGHLQAARGASASTIEQTSAPISHAFFEGLGAGRADRQRGYQISSDRLNDQAVESCTVYVHQDLHGMQNPDPQGFLSSYVQQFRAGYFQGAKKQEKDLLDDDKDRIYQQAYWDKEHDMQRGDALIDDALLVRAIEQALQHIGIRSTEQKQAIISDVEAYVKAYQSYRFALQLGNGHAPGGSSFRPLSTR
ncbi:MAG: hypothetical protein ACRDHW_11575, partial [Ktedonobacteraceae bacterium]